MSTSKSPLNKLKAEADRKRRKAQVDDDGVEITPGCTLVFSYGVPPVVVEAKVIERDGTLIALTPGHTPAEAPVRDITPFFNCWVR